MPKRPPHFPGLYILKDRKALSVGDVVRWGAWWEANEKSRIVRQTLFKNVDPWKRRDLAREIQSERSRREMMPGGNRQNIVDLRFHVSQILVSTVFLGLDHGWGGKPLIFESMIFNGPCHDDMDRYTTWEQAEIGHAEMVTRVQTALRTGDVGEEIPAGEIAGTGSATGR
jgi:hypothetical protein